MPALAHQTSAADGPWAFQTGLVHQIEAALGNHASVLLQLPTGGGKTHVAAAVIRRWNARRKRVWFVCHTRELIQQTCAKLDALRVSHGVVSPEYQPDYERRVQVCSVDTLRNRINKLDDLLQDPGLIVWDECQHVAAPSWSAIKERYAKAKHLGLTATPERLDGTGLGQWFDHLICGPTTRDLIVRGRLSRYHLFAPTIPDLRGVKTRAGDYASDDLAERMGGSVLVGDVVGHYRKLAPGARAIVFAVSVKHSKAVVERFQEAGIPAAHVDGRTPKSERDAAVARLASGEIKVLSNVQVFTEGFDVPAIDAVIVLRPTKSRALFLQMIGRGLREAEGKAATIVLDHAGVVYEHGLPDDDYEWTLEGHAARGAKKPLGSRLRRCSECDAVHEWAAECVECGHAYAAGERTIDEVYGDLREVRKRQPNLRQDYEALGTYAKRKGVNRGVIKALMKAGMPVVVRTTKGRPAITVHIPTADTWFSSHAGENEYEPIEYFARRVKSSPELVIAHRANGLPANDKGWIHIEKGIAWHQDCVKNTLLRVSLMDTESIPYGCVTLADFAERMDLSPDKVDLYARNGLPFVKSGIVRLHEAARWYVDHRDLHTIRSLSRKWNWSWSGVRDYIDRGMPTTNSGMISLTIAENWVRENIPEGKGPKCVVGRDYVGKVSFASRLKIGLKTLSELIEKGLPINPRGFIHVESGLAWYEDYKSKQRK